jgi:co-chaperonin GroES (HSP10)
MKAGINRVLVKIGKNPNAIYHLGEIELAIPEQHIQSDGFKHINQGIVAALPSRLDTQYTPDDYTPLQVLKEGDTVYFHHNQVSGREPLFENIYDIQYYLIYAYKRGSKIHAMPGYALCRYIVEETTEEKQSGIIVNPVVTNAQKAYMAAIDKRNDAFIGSEPMENSQAFFAQKLLDSKSRNTKEYENRQRVIQELERRRIEKQQAADIKSGRKDEIAELYKKVLEPNIVAQVTQILFKGESYNGALDLVNPGQVILYGNSGDIPITIDGRTYLRIRERDMFGYFNKDNEIFPMPGFQIIHREAPPKQIMGANGQPLFNPKAKVERTKSGYDLFNGRKVLYKNQLNVNFMFGNDRITLVWSENILASNRV